MDCPVPSRLVPSRPVSSGMGVGSPPAACEEARCEGVARPSEGGVIDPQRSRFQVISGRSAVLIEARSNVGPIAFGTTSVDGYVDVTLGDQTIDLDGSEPTATLTVELTTLTSGNSLYDAELLRRIDARRHPVTGIELRSAARVGRSERYQVGGGPLLPRRDTTHLGLGRGQDRQRRRVARGRRARLRHS